MATRIHPKNVQEKSPKNVHEMSPKKRTSRGQKCPWNVTKCVHEMSPLLSTRCHLLCPRDVCHPLRIYQNFFGCISLNTFTSCLFSILIHSVFGKPKLSLFLRCGVFLSRLDCIVTKCSCSHDIVIIMIIGWFHLACLLSYLLWKYRGFALIMVFWFQRL